MKLIKKLLIISCLASLLTCAATPSIHGTSHEAILLADGETQSGGYEKRNQKIVEPTSIQIIKAV